MPRFAVPGNQPVRIETACGNCGELVHTTRWALPPTRWSNLTGWTHVDTGLDRCGK